MFTVSGMITDSSTWRRTDGTEVPQASFGSLRITLPDDSKLPAIGSNQSYLCTAENIVTKGGQRLLILKALPPGVVAPTR